MADHVTVSADELRDLALGILTAIGCSDAAAGEIAHHLVEADLRGVSSHGTMRLTQYAAQAASGYLDPTGEAALGGRDDTGGPTRHVDGHRGFGHPAAALAAEIGIDTCRSHGVAFVAVSNCGHTGRIGHYAETAATAGLASIVINGGSWWRWLQVAPFGGIDPKLPTNPYAFGFPGGEDGPLIADFATGATSGGRAMATSRRGEHFDEPLVLDTDGRPSTDPNAYLDGGAIVPMAGHKGTGMGLMAELLATAMLGDDTPESGLTMIVLDPTRHAAAADIDARREAIFEHVRSSRLAPGHDEILIPGQRGRAIAAERRRDGVPVPRVVWDDLQALAADPTKPAS